MRRRLKIGLLTCMRALGLFALVRRLTARRARILCYHGIWRGSDGFAGDALFMTSSRFRRHLELLRADGYEVVSLERVLEHLVGSADPLSAPVAITIDDGWYSTYTDMWPPLREMGFPATLYVDSGTLLSGRPVPHVMARYLVREAGRNPRDYQALIDAAAPHGSGRSLDERLEATNEVIQRLGFDAEELAAKRRFEYMTPDELREAHSEGLDVQLHTRNHLLPERSADEIEREVVANRDDLVQTLSCDPKTLRHFCYPSGVHAPEMHDGLRRAEVVSATTTVLGLADSHHDHFALPRLIMGEWHSDIEFRAELSGVMDVLRGIKRLGRGTR